ncbi:MAG: hypothetical protein IPK66_10435 [Rhodospirillales bacterium]|nr:hypothetical protein [Rhodospirillales bacterium]
MAQAQSDLAPGSSAVVANAAVMRGFVANLRIVAGLNQHQPFDMRGTIAGFVDASVFDEFKPPCGATLITGFACVVAYPAGIVAENEVLFSRGAVNAAHFVQLCSRPDIPLIFLENIIGLMKGRTYKPRSTAKDGAKTLARKAGRGATPNRRPSGRQSADQYEIRGIHTAPAPARGTMASSIRPIFGWPSGSGLVAAMHAPPSKTDFGIFHM